MNEHPQSDGMVSVVMMDLRGVKQRIGDTMSDFLVMNFAAQERSLSGFANIPRLDRRVRCRWRIQRDDFVHRTGLTPASLLEATFLCSWMSQSSSCVLVELVQLS